MTTYRTLGAGQQAEVWVGGPALPRPELLFSTDQILIEAPNWSLDGSSLLVNGHGALWRLDVGSPDRGLVAIGFQGLPAVNNDHVLDPDGEHIYMSAMDGHIYCGHLSGGPVVRVTPDDGVWHFLHGVSPDGTRLAYVQLADFAEPGRLAVMPFGHEPVVIDTGRGHLDGPEWSPDGRWIYANSESFSRAAGHAQLSRIPDAGGPIEQLVVSETVDWFPHLSPDSMYATYVSFPTGTLGHPPDVDVEVRVVATTNWSEPLQHYPVFGGQGTLNVNSWATDSARFAFVAYPVASRPSSRRVSG